jgi:hypothetical protein
MGDYSVPEQIRAMKPKGTMVKAIRGHYYVYEYRSTIKDGKRKTEMGPCVGSITEDLGFVANANRARTSEVTTLEFGQYAAVLANSGDIFGMLKEHFNAADAAAVYCMAVINCVNGMTPMKDVGRHLAMGLLSLRFPSVRLGPDAASSLVDALGRRQGPVMAFEAALCAASNPEVAIDGHAMASTSLGNDLAEPGYRRSKLGSDQVNLLMAYDVESGTPLISRVYEGAVLDKASVRDLLTRSELRGKLFVVDAGFYSTVNLEAFGSGGNSYIIPLHKGLKACKAAVADADVDGRFVYRRNRRASAIEYREHGLDGGARVILFRDLNKAALEQSGYLAKLEQGARGYTQAGFEAARGVMGVIVLQTNRRDLFAQEVYEAYKRRWSIETFFDYLKNDAGLTSFGVQDYCKAQGLAFVMLVTALVHKRVSEASGKVRGKSVDDCLLEARMVKVNKVGGEWVPGNLLERQRKLFDALGTPLSVEPFLPHT